MLDLIIIGAGPAGLSAAEAAVREGLSYLVIEKGTIANTIRQYPVGRAMFSTPNEVEMHEGTLKPVREKPTREEMLSHYIHFVLDLDLHINTAETVVSVNGNIDEGFVVKTNVSEYKARRVLFAIGAMERQRRISRFVFSEEGARTTMAIWREDWENRDPKAGAMKHWVRTPLEAEVTAGRLRVVLYKHVVASRETGGTLTAPAGESLTIPNDVVFVLVGSDADLTLLKQLGVQTESGKLAEVPVYDPETFETNVRGIYVAGHFTHARHIKAAIDVPRRIVPLIAKELKE